MYERRIGEIAWRYASANALFGITVLDRLVSGRPPLAEGVVRLLAGQEPTLGQLRRALSIPSSRRRVARDMEEQQYSEEERELLLGMLRGAYYNVTHQMVDGWYRTETEGTTVSGGMSPFISGSNNPLSRMTAASLADLGYQVDLDAAEPYALPDLLKIARSGDLVPHSAPIGDGIMLPVVPTELPLGDTGGGSSCHAKNRSASSARRFVPHRKITPHPRIAHCRSL